MHTKHTDKNMQHATKNQHTPATITTGMHNKQSDPIHTQNNSDQERV